MSKRTDRALTPASRILPARLHRGDRAALIAPSSPASEKQLREAVRSLRELGLEPVTFSSCLSRREYLSGDDRLRALDLMLAFSDPKIRAVFCLRGGYGSARILNLIDYDVIRRNPKIFAGFSDATALHAAIFSKCRLITYHAPMPSFPYRKYDSDITLASLREALFSEHGSYELKKAGSGSPVSSAVFRETEKEKVVMSGTLCGGNLTVFASLLGTPYEPDTGGCILFLEDIGEETYRVDRAFTSLCLAGKLDGCRGILLGTFSGCNPPHRGWRSCEEIIKETAAAFSVPVVYGLPCGHSAPNLTLPIGARCSVIAIPYAERHILKLRIGS